MNLVETIAQKLINCKHAIVISGAGLSTPSGIPDFRSADLGLYNSKLDMELLTSDALYSDPAAFFANFAVFTGYAAGKKPNAAHYALAELQSLGVLHEIVDQNVDGFCLEAGCKSVIEVHGNIRESRCDGCGKLYPYKLMADQVDVGTMPPKSPCCRRLLRPQTVLFGDMLPSSYFSFVQSMKADFGLVVGTSLNVWPVAGLPDALREFVIINKEPTVKDRQAALVVREPLETVLPAVAAAVKNML